MGMSIEMTLSSYVRLTFIHKCTETASQIPIDNINTCIQLITLQRILRIQIEPKYKIIIAEFPRYDECGKGAATRHASSIILARQIDNLKSSIFSSFVL